MPFESNFSEVDEISTEANETQAVHVETWKTEADFYGFLAPT